MEIQSKSSRTLTYGLLCSKKQNCRMELRDNGEFRPGAFNQWTSSVADPNLNDIGDQSFAETDLWWHKERVVARGD